MRELALRLTAIDPEAGAAVRIIGHFDALVASRAGLQSIVGGAAELTGHGARLVDPGRRLVVRFLADGSTAPCDTTVDAGWPSVPVTDDGAVLWLEATAPVGTLEVVVLERAAAAARAVLERTRSLRAEEDPASIELVLDGEAAAADRLSAARRLGLPATSRAVALADGTALVVPADAATFDGQRAGVGPEVTAADLPSSWEAARLALRLTAEGTQADPGPRVVQADQLGVIALVVLVADGQKEAVPDVLALQRAATAAPWALGTLETVAAAPSMRDAARVLQMHHSTLQDRLGQAEALLGWSIREPHGRLRLQLALALRRAMR